MQPNPTHCTSPADAAAVAQQGPNVREPCTTVRCARGARGGVRGQQPHQIRGARHVPEPPRLQEAPPTSRGRVRLHQPRTLSHPLRRNALPRRSPVHFPVRPGQIEPVLKPRTRRLSETLLPRRHQQQPRLLA